MAIHQTKRPGLGVDQTVLARLVAFVSFSRGDQLARRSANRSEERRLLIGECDAQAHLSARIGWLGLALQTRPNVRKRLDFSR